jgi:hypothetical protein
MFNLGDKVFAVIDGEITEIRKVGNVIKYTVTDMKSKEFVSSVCTENDLVNQKGNKNGITKSRIKKRK